MAARSQAASGVAVDPRVARSRAVIVEAAFMDTKSPDNDALHDERFKQIVAQAVREAVQEWNP